MKKYIDLLDFDLQHKVFSDDRIKPMINILAIKLQAYLKSLNIFTKTDTINVITTILGLIIFPIFIYYLNINWTYYIYGIIIWLIASGASGSNGRIWYIPILLSVYYYLIINNYSNSLQYLVIYGIGIWLLTYIEYKITIQIYYLELKKNKELFLECAKMGLIDVKISEADVNKFYKNKISII